MFYLHVINGPPCIDTGSWRFQVYRQVQKTKFLIHTYTKARTKKTITRLRILLSHTCTYCICMYVMTMYNAVRIPLVSNCAI